METGPTSLTWRETGTERERREESVGVGEGRFEGGRQGVERVIGEVRVEAGVVGKESVEARDRSGGGYGGDRKRWRRRKVVILSVKWWLGYDPRNCLLALL